MVIRPIFVVLLAVATAVAFAGGPGEAHAQAGAKAKAGTALEAPVIAVVDLQKILRESLAGQSVGKQLGTIRKGFEDEIRKDESALRQADRDLASQRALLAPEAFAQRQQELRGRLAGLQRKANERRRALDIALQTAMNKVRNVLFRVATDLAKERNINVMLPKNSVLLIAKSLDLTEVVMERLNAKLKSVKVEVPKKLPAQPAAPKKK